MKILYSKFVLAAVALCIAMGINAQPKFNAISASKFAKAELVQPQLKLNPEKAQPQKAIKTGIRKTEGWTSIGEGTLSETPLSDFMELDNQTYSVVIEQNNENSNLYRVVNPFGEGYPNYQGMLDLSYEYTSGTYLTFDVSNPNNVTLTKQTTGWSQEGDTVYVESTAGGTFSNNKVSWTNTIQVSQGTYEPTTGTITITLPIVGWKNVGKGECVESILMANLAEKGGPVSSNITVYQNEDDENIYRFAPFGTEYSQYAALEGAFTSTDEGYVTIDITDPENVTIEQSSIGWSWGNYGQITMSATGGVLDKYGVITFADAYLHLGTQYALPGGFSITLPDKIPTESWSEWVPFAPKGDSTGVYTYTLQGSNNPITVCNRHDNNMPEVQQFKFKNWGDSTAVLVDLILNYNSETGVVTIPKQETGFTYYTYGMVFIECLAGTYNPKNGLFTLPVSYTVSEGTFGSYNEQLKMNGFADYSFSIILDDFIEDAATSVAAQKFYCTSVDGANFRYTIKSSKEIQSEAQIAAIAQGLTGEFTNLTTTYGSVNANADALYFIIVSSYDEKGDFDSYKYTTFYYSPSAGWTSLGMCDYTDDIASAIYGQSLPIPTYKVEIQENKKYAGFYRLKNPYGATFPYHGGKKYYRTDVYMYIIAINPKQVQLTYPTDEQMLGVDWGFGEMMIQMTDYDYPGTMVDGVITFPQGGGTKTPFLTVFGNEAYYGNYNGKFKVVIPRDTVEVTAAAGKATFYSAYNTYVPAGTAKTYTYEAGNSYVQEDATLTAGQVLPANTGVIFEPTAEIAEDTIFFTFIRTAKNNKDEISSALSGVTEETAISDFVGSTIYTLANGNNGVGFYPFAGETLAANKAFLAIPIGADVKFIALDQETGISSINANANANAAIFNLAGQRVEKLQKGVNIVNGKKVLY